MDQQQNFIIELQDYLLRAKVNVSIETIDVSQIHEEGPEPIGELVFKYNVDFGLNCFMLFRRYKSKDWLPINASYLGQKGLIKSIVKEIEKYEAEVKPGYLTLT